MPLDEKRSYNNTAMTINWQPNHDASRFRKKKPSRLLVENPRFRKPKLDTMLCPVCSGRGTRIDAKTKAERVCTVCRGEGRVKK